ANFLKGCGFNEKEIEKIVYSIRDDSLNARIKEPAVIGGKGVVAGAESPGLKLLNESANGKLSDTEINKKGVASELSNRGTEIFHKGIRTSDNLINESFSRGELQYNISHVNNAVADVNEGDIKPYILIKQIVEGVGKKLSNGIGRVKIALHPPHLGALHMDVVLNNDKVQVILQVENDKVRHILQLNVEQLKNSLNSNGLIVDNVNVLLQERSDNNNYGFEQNGYLFKEGRNQGEGGGDRGERDFLGHDSSKSEEKELGLRADGRISLFA
ncbi:MAG: flagellar hook-length control protein FliK, partial [Methanophagales archaeon]|nr:flagellar hook-length control protein FliK [Methanophagales archaeon]